MMSVLLYARKPWGVCKCGHYQWQHDDSVIRDDHMPIARGNGHGRCGCEDCDCEMYTWVKFEKALGAERR